MPNRGEIWPACVSDIALPPPGTVSVPLEQVSATAAAYLQNYQTRMLRLLRERLENSKTVREAPYVDPLIKKDVLKLAVRMAKAGMLRAASHCHATVGLFTVVKKVLDKDEIGPTGEVVKPAGTVVLRLALDLRVPNLLWQDPPWVALGGPGALSSLDLSRLSEGRVCVPHDGHRGCTGLLLPAGTASSILGVVLLSRCRVALVVRSPGLGGAVRSRVRLDAECARREVCRAGCAGHGLVLCRLLGTERALQDLTHGIRAPSGISPISPWVQERALVRRRSPPASDVSGAPTDSFGVSTSTTIL